MSNLQKVVAVQDDSCHWYVIPAESLHEFRDLEEKASNEDLYENACEFLDQFNDKFGKYRTGGDLNMVQLYAEL